MSNKHDPIGPLDVVAAYGNPTETLVTCGYCLTTVPNVITTRELTVKRRSKFGVLWLTATILTGGLALIAYLVWPRHREVVGVATERHCANCKRRVG